MKHPDNLESAHKCSSKVSESNGGEKKQINESESIAIHSLCKAKVKYVGNILAI